uniref:Uncharacterized protein n=1 Tax=Panagrellus redivivus TaxID=6233 RepID=A0A7E4V853_PANRE
MVTECINFLAGRWWRLPGDLAAKAGCHARWRKALPQGDLTEGRHLRADAPTGHGQHSRCRQSVTKKNEGSGLDSRDGHGDTSAREFSDKDDIRARKKSLDWFRSAEEEVWTEKVPLTNRKQPTIHPQYCPGWPGPSDLSSRVRGRGPFFLFIPSVVRGTRKAPKPKAIGGAAKLCRWSCVSPNEGGVDMTGDCTSKSRLPKKNRQKCHYGKLAYCPGGAPLDTSGAPRHRRDPGIHRATPHRCPASQAGRKDAAPSKRTVLFLLLFRSRQQKCIHGLTTGAMSPPECRSSGRRLPGDGLLGCPRGEMVIETKDARIVAAARPTTWVDTRPFGAGAVHQRPRGKGG